MPRACHDNFGSTFSEIMLYPFYGDQILKIKLENNKMFSKN